MIKYLITLAIVIGIVLPIIILVETFKMFNNIKNIKELLIEQIENQNQILVRIEDIRTNIKNKKD